jgi:hypothetical protein
MPNYGILKPHHLGFLCQEIKKTAEPIYFLSMSPQKYSVCEENWNHRFECNCNSFEVILIKYLDFPQISTMKYKCMISFPEPESLKTPAIFSRIHALAHQKAIRLPLEFIQHHLDLIGLNARKIPIQPSIPKYVRLIPSSCDIPGPLQRWKPNISMDSKLYGFLSRYSN